MNELIKQIPKQINPPEVELVKDKRTTKKTKQSKTKQSKAKQNTTQQNTNKTQTKHTRKHKTKHTTKHTTKHSKTPYWRKIFINLQNKYSPKLR